MTTSFATHLQCTANNYEFHRARVVRQVITDRLENQAIRAEWSRSARERTRVPPHPTHTCNGKKTRRLRA